MIVYIWGNLTVDNFTPRPEKDTVGTPAQQAGLSAWGVLAPGRKAQGIDIDKLKPPLRAIPDEPQQGGQAGHFSIVPVDDSGQVDAAKLQAWADTRGSGQTHEFTQILLDAIVEPNLTRNP